MEAAPQPPSLHLPKPVSDLAATRDGNQVQLEWNTPKESTDRLRLQGVVRFRICRSTLGTSSCDTVAIISSAPGQRGQYTEVLPPALTVGPARAIGYRILGINERGRTAGPSNAALVLAGQAPPSVRELSAEVVERGVALRWQPVKDLVAGTTIEILRTSPPLKPKKDLNGPPTQKNGLNRSPAKQKIINPFSEPTEPLQQTLRVTLSPANAQAGFVTDPGIALDRSAQFGREYTYTASRAIERRVENHRLRLASSPSESVEVLVRDTFPPAAPKGLVAVPISAEMNNGHPEIDLSWSANTEPDLAQYRIYRRDIGENGDMQLIAPSNTSGTNSEAIVAPEFRDMRVQPCHSYVYAVTAVDTSGNESHRSAEVSVTVPKF